MKKDIVKNLKELKKPLKLITDDEELIKILNDLEESLSGRNGYGLAANQIGYDKKVAIIRMEGPTGEILKINLINPIITEKKDRFLFLLIN